MTPQLQQAIRLLQLSTLELQLEVQGVLDSNLMLERDEGEAQSETENAMDSVQEKGDKEEAPASNEQASDASESEISSNADTIPDDLPVDTNWEDCLLYTSPSPRD